MKKHRFSNSDIIVLRDIWDGKIWGVHPEIVVQDSPDMIVLYRPSGTCIKRRIGLHGNSVSVVERKLKQWVLTNKTNDSFCCLRLKIPDETYSILAFFNPDHDSLLYWYINLETPFTRTTSGYDYTDCILDVIVERNLQSWHWDDEDELKEAVETGLFSQDYARKLYAKGEEARDLLLSGESIFNKWEYWRPDPTWKIPVIPAGWDNIEKPDV